MSVYDENRRQCSRCGKMINHWEDNDCEKGLCKKSTRIESVYGFKTEDVDNPITQSPINIFRETPTSQKDMEETNRRNNQMSLLLEDARKKINEAIAAYIIDNDCAKLFEQISFAQSLVVSANYIGGVVGK